MPISNSLGFLDTPVNGDVPEIDIVQTAKPKSDFYINPPRFKVDDYIQRGINEARRLITSVQTEDFETSTDVVILAGSVINLIEEKKQMTEDRNALHEQLNAKRNDHSEASKSANKLRIKDLDSEISLLEAALKRAEELLHA